MKPDKYKKKIYQTKDIEKPEVKLTPEHWSYCTVDAGSSLLLLPTFSDIYGDDILTEVIWKGKFFNYEATKERNS